MPLLAPSAHVHEALNHRAVLWCTLFSFAGISCTPKPAFKSALSSSTDVAHLFRLNV